MTVVSAVREMQSISGIRPQIFRPEYKLGSISDMPSTNELGAWFVAPLTFSPALNLASTVVQKKKKKNVASSEQKVVGLLRPPPVAVIIGYDIRENLRVWCRRHCSRFISRKQGTRIGGNHPQRLSGL